MKNLVPQLLTSMRVFSINIKQILLKKSCTVLPHLARLPEFGLSRNQNEQERNCQRVTMSHQTHTITAIQIDERFHVELRTSGNFSNCFGISCCCLMCMAHSPTLW
uniref:Uncharacterized protein n=1 Tax=Sphaerodactylus townsendi TaxID=933632 RepID=A0ACB8EYB5_9SAUR